MNSHLKTRLGFLRSTIPTARRRRTARGRLRTCRGLGEHIARARQLYGLAADDTERAWIDELVAELERRRTELADGGGLASRVRADRAARVEARKALFADFL